MRLMIHLKYKKMNKTIKHIINAKTILLSSFLLVVVFVITSCDPDETQTVATFNNLVMSDEFDTDGAPNPELWGNWIGTAFNNELQYYTDRPENITVQNGVLIISAKKEDFNGSSYTSARIESKGLFEQKHGRFEARMRLPYGKGLWPAFWLLGADIDSKPWPNCGEIDILEYLGDEPSTIFGTVHGPGYSGVKSISKSYELTNDRFDTGFHVFGIEWGPKYINYYVDDVLYNQITPEDVPGEWVFDNGPFYIIINLAVGGDLPGSPNAETVFPQTLLVDYVRVYTNGSN
jgi:beta-glucanase (GH16 family)